MSTRNQNGTVSHNNRRRGANAMAAMMLLGKPRGDHEDQDTSLHVDDTVDIFCALVHLHQGDNCMSMS
ncbi:unnamed protein product [Amoebophrya sp. A25]|nr:unnamed protein product [Amoebophrya sp. A25]|eukprot:GSA25T00003987001.1